MTPTGRPWLSRQATELFARLRDTAKDSFDCDLLIVGSGYGGAVAAARAAGHQVPQPDGRLRPARIWVLERGSEYQPGMFPSRFSELAGHVRFDTQAGQPALGRPEGLFDARIGSDVGVLLGNGLGGGSLINAGVMEKPAAGVFAEHWPHALEQAELDDGYRKVHEMLRPRAVPADKECSKLHVLDELVRPYQAGRCEVTVHWRNEDSAVGVPMQACTLCGDCLTGCNQSAKGSLDTNYLAFARARHVEMFCGGTVRTVARAGHGWDVHWQYTDRKLQRDAGTFVVRAQRVVLAAGALGSTEILLRSQTADLVFSGQLGGGFSANGDKITAGAKHPRRVVAVGHAETDPANADERRVGPTITGLIRVPPGADDTEPGFALEEFAVPAGLRNVYGEIVGLLAALGEDRVGSTDPYAVTDDDIDHIALYGSMGDDGAKGTIELPAPPAAGGRTEGVTIKWPDLRTHPLFRRVGAWLQTRQQPAITVPNPAAPLPGGFFLTVLPPVTVHPLGGCRMADEAGAGVVDHCGRVFNPKGGLHTGLFVLDGSIVPRALGINPAFTIAALAERAMPLLLHSWGWHAAEGTTRLAPRPRGRRRELPARDVVWSIRERVQGPCSIDGHRHWARLEIEFEEIPGFRRALALTGAPRRRRVHRRRARGAPAGLSRHPRRQRRTVHAGAGRAAWRRTHTARLSPERAIGAG
jgi:cholesterol oxidase